MALKLKAMVIKCVVTFVNSLQYVCVWNAHKKSAETRGEW